MFVILNRHKPIILILKAHFININKFKRPIPLSFTDLVYFTILGWVKTLAFQAKSFIVVFLDLDHTKKSVSHTRYYLILHNCIMD